MSLVIAAIAALSAGILIRQLRGRWWMLGLAFWFLVARITEPLYMARELPVRDDQSHPGPSGAGDH